MMNRQTGERMTAQTWTGRDYRDAPTTAETVTSVPTAAEAAALFSKAEVR